MTESLLTCESVLSEAAFHLRSCACVLSVLDDELLQVAFDCYQNIRQMPELAGRYADRKPDLAGLCLVCVSDVSELYPRYSVIMVDEADFRVHKRGAISLICPPREN